MHRNQLETDLVTAVRNRQHNRARQLLEQGVKGTERVENSETVLHLAVKNADDVMLGILLDHNVDASARDKDNKTALFHATEICAWHLMEVFASRFRERFTPQHPCGEYQFGAALIKAVQENHYETAQLFLAAGAPTKWFGVNENNLTCLHIAALNGNAHMVRLLLQHKADATSRRDYINEGKHTPVVIAAHKGHWDCVLAFANNLIDKENQLEFGSALFFAVKANKVFVAEKLLAAGADCDYVDADTLNNSLHEAVVRNNPAMVTSLIHHSYPKNRVNKNKELAETIAFNNQYHKCHAAFYGAKVSRVKLEDLTFLLFLFASKPRDTLFTKDGKIIPYSVLKIILNYVFASLGRPDFVDAAEIAQSKFNNRRYINSVKAFIAEYNQVGTSFLSFSKKSPTSVSFVQSLELVIAANLAPDVTAANLRRKIDNITELKKDENCRVNKLLEKHKLFRPVSVDAKAAAPLPKVDEDGLRDDGYQL